MLLMTQKLKPMLEPAISKSMGRFANSKDWADISVEKAIILFRGERFIGNILNNLIILKVLMKQH